MHKELQSLAGVGVPADIFKTIPAWKPTVWHGYPCRGSHYIALVVLSPLLKTDRAKRGKVGAPTFSNCDQENHIENVNTIAQQRSHFTGTRQLVKLWSVAVFDVCHKKMKHWKIERSHSPFSLEPRTYRRFYTICFDSSVSCGDTLSISLHECRGNWWNKWEQVKKTCGHTPAFPPTSTPALRQKEETDEITSFDWMIWGLSVGCFFLILVTQLFSL